MEGWRVAKPEEEGALETYIAAATTDKEVLRSGGTRSKHGGNEVEMAARCSPQHGTWHKRNNFRTFKTIFGTKET